MHYQQAGQGPDLILIHGLFCNLAFWYLSVVPLLARHFRVTVYDLRGHGHSERTGNGYRAVDLADDLNALMEHLDIEHAHVVGHSFGGAVALAFTIRYPQRVDTLMLADAWVPSLQPMNSGFWKNRRQQLDAAGVDVQGEKIPRVAYSFFEELIVHEQSPNTHQDVNPDLLNSLRVDPKNSAALKKWWRLVNDTSAVREMSDTTGITPAEIRQIRQPTMALFGRKSNYLPTLRRLRAILRDCNTVMIADAGHFFPILRPKILADTITRSIAPGNHYNTLDAIQRKSA